jgi:uncharacterized protein (TIGR03435 family)
MRPIIFGIVFFGACLTLSAEEPTFDAASVKLAGPEVQQPYTITGGPGTNDPSRFRAPHIALFNLLARAFGVSTDQIVGPAWIRDLASVNNFTVVATMPPDTTKEQFERMLQNLLVERFHLAFRHEMRDFPGYELVVDKGGPKFKEVTPTKDAAPNLGTTVIIGSGNAGGPDDFPNLPGPRTMSQVRGGLTRTKYQERSIAEFVSNLGFIIGSAQGKSVLDGYPQPRVIDKTGLAGKYTFILEFYNASNANLAARVAAQTGKAPLVAASDPDEGGPTIFNAVQKQLGLRLNKIADVPTDTIVVENLDKLPTPD